MVKWAFKSGKIILCCNIDITFCRSRKKTATVLRSPFRGGGLAVLCVFQKIVKICVGVGFNDEADAVVKVFQVSSRKNHAIMR